MILLAVEKGSTYKVDTVKKAEKCALKFAAAHFYMWPMDAYYDVCIIDFSYPKSTVYRYEKENEKIVCTIF